MHVKSITLVNKNFFCIARVGLNDSVFGTVRGIWIGLAPLVVIITYISLLLWKSKVPLCVRSIKTAQKLCFVSLIFSQNGDLMHKLGEQRKSSTVFKLKVFPLLDLLFSENLLKNKQK